MAIAESLPKPDVYYDPWTSGKSYFVRNQRGNYIPVTETNLKRMLKAQGFSTETEDNAMLSEMDEIMNDIQTGRDVEYAGPLAGYRTGIHENGKRILVTDSPRLIDPAPGDWPTLEAIIRNLLIDREKLDGDTVGEIQINTLFGWLQVAINALRKGVRRPGQVLVIAGPHNCGKSLLQNLVTHMLGGRSANPYAYMTGMTQFNSEMFQAEHLMIEDEASSFDLRVRRHFGRQLNACIVNETHRCHPKNRQALTLQPWWRVSITLNDEPENLMVLPPLEESLLSKFILLRAHRCEMPMPTESPEQRQAFMRVLQSELPACLWHVLHEHKILPEQRCGRFGVLHFHNPELLSMMSVLAPETKLLELIDTELFGSGRSWATRADGSTGWEGKAADLEAKLCGKDSTVAHEARKLMLYQAACGRYLGQLARMYPDRITGRAIKGYQIWSIDPPERE